MTERRITTPERSCGSCGARTHVWQADTRTWITDAPHGGKCPTRITNAKAAA